MLNDWLQLMGDPVPRWAVTLGVGAVYGTIAWLLGEVPLAHKLSSEVRTYLWVIWVGVSVPTAFFAGRWIPGLETQELLLALVGGGISTDLIAKSPLHKRMFGGGSGGPPDTGGNPPVAPAG